MSLKIIKTMARAKMISAREETKDRDGGVIAIANDGQYCIALIPTWKNWGETLMDGTKLENGKYYKITIEITGEESNDVLTTLTPPQRRKLIDKIEKVKSIAYGEHAMMGKIDPVHMKRGKWYFYDETRYDTKGPFDTEKEAREELKKYWERFLS